MARASRRFTAPLVVALVLRSLSFTNDAFAQPVDAKAQIAEADKAARSKDWAKALSAYQTANGAQPSAEALEGAANAHFQLKHDGEAHAAYSQWLEKYGAAAPAAKKNTARTRLKELEKKTGAFTLTISEPGATVSIDGQPIGSSPLPGPVRLTAGARQVRVEKDGFLPFEQGLSVTAGGTNALEVKLEAQANKGRLIVREKAGKPLRVLVDGVDMGEAPWTGDVDAGQHEVGGRSATLATAPEKVTIERGKTREVELTASAALASVKVATSDGKGLIYLDGKLVGEGSFSADVPAGTHKIRIVREGYDPFEEEILVKDKEPFSRGVTLKLVSKIETGPIVKAQRSLEGVYGGIGVAALFMPSGPGNSIQKGCDNKPPEMIGCEPGSSFGLGFSGFVGYHWDPVGVELMLAGGYDASSPQRDWGPSSTDLGIGPDPARIEDFTIRRFGGMGAARVRYTAQSEKIRFTVAGGVGISRRLMTLERTTEAKDEPKPPNDRVITPDPLGYWAPVVSFEPMILYRLGGPTAIGVGISLLLESPSTFLNDKKTPITNPEGNRRLGASGLTTPAYELASGTQFYLGPFIGMMFGP
ncbi:MAG: PEGA domain-containing protein [Polyangiaceae bacterium]|nr:PEGA domain-containing protein [Polyangiaceae bacterium]